jgi:hypothetical protein
MAELLMKELVKQKAKNTLHRKLSVDFLNAKMAAQVVWAAIIPVTISLSA